MLHDSEHIPDRSSTRTILPFISIAIDKKLQRLLTIAAANADNLRDDIYREFSIGGRSVRLIQHELRVIARSPTRRRSALMRIWRRLAADPSHGLLHRQKGQRLYGRDDLH